MSAGVPARSDADLSPTELRALEEAHAELREAVAAYDHYVPAPVGLDHPATAIPLEELSSAQKRVEVAESRLWELRERLLGWTRPAWALPATEVSDWFSKEDQVYDDLGGGGLAGS